MKNRMKVLFCLRTSKSSPDYATVYVRLTANGQRVNIQSTDVKICKKDFDYNKGRIKGRSATIEAYNRKFDQIQSELVAIANDFETKKIKFSAQQIKGAYLNDTEKALTFLELKAKFIEHLEKCQVLDDEIAKRHSGKVSIGTFKTYRFRLHNFERFLIATKRDKIFGEQVGEDILTLFEDYMSIEKNCGHVYIAKNKQAVRTCLNWAHKRKLIKQNPLSNIVIYCRQELNTDSIRDEDLEKLCEFDFNQWFLQKSRNLTGSKFKNLLLKKQAMEDTRDIYVFSCHTGMAYIEMKKFKFDEVSLHDNRYAIEKNRKKSDTTFFIPLISKSLSIIDIFKKRGFEKFPIKSNQNVNKQLTNVFFTVGIDCNLSFHSARKKQADLCTNVYNMSNEATIKVVGHSSTKMLDAYRKVSNKRVLSEYPDL